jgi:hypothetical protein
MPVLLCVGFHGVGGPRRPSPECHRIQWFKPRSVCNQSCTSCTLLCQPLVCPGTRICLYRFLVPNIFCIPWHRLPESAALEFMARFQPWEGHVVASWESRAVKTHLSLYRRVMWKSRTRAIHDSWPHHTEKTKHKTSSLTDVLVLQNCHAHSWIQCR